MKQARRACALACQNQQRRRPLGTTAAKDSRLIITMSLSALYSPSTYAYTPPRYRGYAPQTPSPLRTSRNANFMPPTPTPDCESRATPEPKLLPFSFKTPTSTISSSSRSDFGSTPRSTSTSGSAGAFQFQGWPRSQSPQASLAKSNAAVKARRSTLFLDKVRQKREDLRFETRGEQALRMDFVRERRAWEERLKRRAPSVEIEADDILMDEADQDVDARGGRVGAELLTTRLTML